MNTFPDEMYVPFTDSLFPGEEQLLSSIINGIDNEISFTIKWLNSHEGKSLLNTSPHLFEEIWKNSIFHKKLEERILRNSTRANQHIANFYKIGMSIGFSDIKMPFKSSDYDTESLKILTNHNESLIKNLDDEVACGIKDVIFGGIVDGLTIPVMVHQLINLPYNPLNIEYTHTITGDIVSPVISPRTRAEVITRTEYARAVNNGTLQAYANYGVSEVDIIPAGDGMVCEECEEHASNNPYSILEVANLIPVHPNCRCGVSVVENYEINEDNQMVVSLVDDL